MHFGQRMTDGSSVGGSLHCTPAQDTIKAELLLAISPRLEEVAPVAHHNDITNTVLED